MGKIDEGTVGDTICERAYKLAKDHEDTNKFWFKALVEIGAYVSYCGSTWQEVATGGKHLTLKKKLCCIKKPGEPLKYRPCNGSKKFNQECKLTTNGCLDQILGILKERFVSKQCPFYSKLQMYV